MPVDHYENFPVASFLLPAHLREPVEAIYAFARSADDIADEGDAQPAERLAGLDAYRRALRAIEHGKPCDDPALAPIFERLGEAIRRFKLPPGLFRDLLADEIPQILAAGSRLYAIPAALGSLVVALGPHTSLTSASLQVLAATLVAVLRDRHVGEPHQAVDGREHQGRRGVRGLHGAGEHERGTLGGLGPGARRIPVAVLEGRRQGVAPVRRGSRRWSSHRLRARGACR